MTKLTVYININLFNNYNNPTNYQYSIILNNFKKENILFTHHFKIISPINKLNNHTTSYNSISIIIIIIKSQQIISINHHNTILSIKNKENN